MNPELANILNSGTVQGEALRLLALAYDQGSRDTLDSLYESGLLGEAEYRVASAAMTQAQSGFINDN